MTGTVKALEWWTSDTGDWCADTLIGRYQVQKVTANRNFRLFVPGERKEVVHPDTGYWPEEEAKKAAQAHFNASILSALTASASEPGEPVTVTYRNWRGEIAERQIKPLRIWFGSTEWHPEPQWLITAFDVEKGAERDFALSGFSAPVPASEPEPVAGNQFADAIYIASKVKHADKWRGLASIHPVSSSWIFEAGVGETADFHDLWQRCLSEASTSKALVAYREPGEVLKGAWAEIGAALAHHVPVHAVGLEEFSIAKYRGITHHATLEEAVKEALSEPRRTLAKPVPTPDGAVEASVETVAAMLLGSVNAPEQAIYRVARQIVGALSHPADGWRDIESAPTGWGNFFFVRPCGMHHSGKPFLPTIVQFVDGEFYTPENELDPVYFGQNEPEDSPLKSTLEWFPIPQGWITAAPLDAKAERE